jgi:hypothetical protein
MKPDTSERSQSQRALVGCNPGGFHIYPGLRKKPRRGPPSFYSQPNNKGGCPILAIFPIARVGSNKAKCPSPGIFGPGIFLSKVLYHLPAKHQPSSPATASATVSTALTPTAHQPAPRAG